MKIAFLVWDSECDEYPTLRTSVPCGAYYWVRIVYCEVDED
jgi:hypothetical protein